MDDAPLNLRLSEIPGLGTRIRKAISACIKKEWSMRFQPLLLGAAAALALSACSFLRKLWNWKTASSDA
jgi:hypothetical protein